MVAALAASAGSLVVDRSGLFALIALFVLVVPFEKLFPRHRQRLRRPAVATDAAFAVTSGPLSIVGIAVGAVIAGVSLVWLPALALRPVVAALPPLLTVVLGVLLFDAVTYWAHRFAHEIPFLWRFHAIHHSTRHLDWVSGFRVHPVDGAFLAPAAVFLIVAGFSAELTGVLAAVQFLIGLFAHANVRWRLRPLQRIVLTPEFHHWHHADEPEAIGTNYAVFLPIWDQLFGTYRVPRDRRPMVYGVSEHVPAGFVAQLVHPFRGLRGPSEWLRHPVRSARSTCRSVWRGLRAMAGSVRRSIRRTRTGSYTA